MKTSRKMATLAASLTTFGTFAGVANAVTFIPFGVQQNIAVQTVTDVWEWTLVYQGTYDTFDVPIEDLYVGASGPNTYVMYAARETGSATITLLAAAPVSDVRTVTSNNGTTTSNGAEWYYNARSIGFAGLGDTITQSTADNNSATNPELRLSWHTGGGATGFGGQVDGVAPLDVDGGWRVGATTTLNASTDFERLVFVATVPEPSSALLLGLGGLGFLTRRKRIS